jgi:hypothetical protein
MKRKLYWIEKSDIIVVLVLVQVGFFLSVMKQRKHVMCFRDHSQSLHDWIAGKYMCCSGIKREGGRNSCVCFNLIYILSDQKIIFLIYWKTNVSGYQYRPNTVVTGESIYLSIYIEKMKWRYNNVC